ncbi:hypothetical protein K1D78_25525, partial [Escherichia coli]|nr:hypothetical protein [Escherichia coli]
MKSLLLLPLLLLGVNAGPSYTECYSGPNLGGYYVYFDNYAPDLYANGIDNDIESVYQTGMWIYYENYDYNVAAAGLVYFVHGIDITVN